MGDAKRPRVDDTADLPRVPLPGTDLMVSRVCLGTMAFVGAGGMGSASDDAAAATLAAALDAGVNFIDMAEAYADHEAERVVGRAIKGRDRGGLVLATKFGIHKGEHSVPYTEEMIRDACGKSLAALGTDYIDLYQVHWAANMASAAETVRALEKLKSEGKIKAYGVSNFGVESLKEFFDAGGRPATNQLPYNLLWRAIEHGILPLCREKGVGVLTYSSLQQGLLTGRFRKPEDVPEGRRRTRHFAGTSTTLSRHGGVGNEKVTFAAIAALAERCDAARVPMAEAATQWLLQQPGVTAVLIGASTPEQVRENVAAASRALPDAAAAGMSADTAALKQALGPDPDMWAATSRYR